MPATNIGPKIGIDGEAEFRAQLRSMGEQLKTLGTEMKAVTSAFDANDKSQTALASKSDVLTRQLDVQRARIEEIQKALDHARANYDENSTEVQRWQQALNNATTDLNNTQRELDNLGREMEETGDSTKDMASAMASAGENTSGLAGKLGSGLATAAKVGAAAIAAVTAAAAALTAALLKGVGETAEYGDNIDKMSQKMGMSAEAYQEWDAIMRHSGTSIESLQSGMKTLANAVENGNDAFARLGISQEQIAKMSNEELFSATISALQNVDNETERTYLAGQLLGRGATELGALLNTSAEDTEAMRQRVHELGGVMSDEAVKASAAYQDSLQDMQTAIQGISRGLMTDLMPSVTSIMDGLTEIFSGGDSKAGVDMISQGVEGIINSLAASAPQFVDTAANIVTSVAESIVQSLPLLFDTGVQMLDQLVDGIYQAVPDMIAALPGIIDGFLDFITEHLPEVLEQGTSMVQSMADGILEAIPELLNAVPQIIESFVTFISENLPVILDSGIDLLLSLADGIITAVPDLVAQLPQIVQNIADTLSANFPKIIQTGVNMLIKLGDGILSALPNLLGIIPQVTDSAIDLFNTMVDSVKEIGSNVIRGLWNGINDMAGWIAEKIKGFGDGILNSLKNFFGIHSPSTLFREEVGQYIGLGVAAGIEDSTDKAVKSADTMAKNVYKRSKEWADRQTKYLGLSYDDQIALWQTIQGQFVKSSAQYADAEEVIFDIREKQAKELAKTQEEAAKQQEKALDEYQKKAETIYKNINDLETDYQDALTDRAQEIYNTYGLFDQIAERQKVSGDELTRNLKGQVNMMEEFYSGLDELFDRGVTAELVDEIRAMGPDAIDELNALLGMTDKQLSEYAALYQEKQQLANDVALEELEGLRQQTNQQIMDQLRGLEQLYDEYAPQVGTALTDGMALGIESGMSNVINSAVRAAQAAVAAVKNALDIHSPSGVFADEVGKNMALGLGEGFTNEMRRVSANMQTAIPTPTVDTVNNAAAGMVNGLAAMGGGQNFPSTIVLKLENGAEVARWQLPYLRRAERSDPEVVSGV